MFHRPLKLMAAALVLATTPVFGVLQTHSDSSLNRSGEMQLAPAERIDVQETDTPMIPQPQVETREIQSDTPLAVLNNNQETEASEMHRTQDANKVPDEMNHLAALLEQRSNMSSDSQDHMVPQPMPAPQSSDSNLMSPSLSVEEGMLSDAQLETNSRIMSTEVPAPATPTANPTIAPSDREVNPNRTQVVPETDAAQQPLALADTTAATPSATNSVTPQPGAAAMEEHTAAQGQEQPYHNAEKGYSLSFPADWEVKQGFMGLDVFGLSPLKNADDKFRENVNVVTEDLRTPLTLDEYYDLGLKNLALLLTDFKELDSGKMDINGVPARWVIYDHRMGEVHARVLQVILVHGERAFIVTSTASPDEFDSYRPIFDTIVKTFRFDNS